MPAKKKVKATPVAKRDLSTRASAVAKAHPKITITSVLTFVALVGGGIPTWEWLSAQEAKYERVQAAEAMDAKLRTELKVQHEQEAQRQRWQAVAQAELKTGQAKGEALALRNRVNDCREKMATKKIVGNFATTVCQQYEDELKDAQERTVLLANEAAALRKRALGQ